jgi:hypothetical protein
LEKFVDQKTHDRWLHRKTVAHIRRDRNRSTTAKNEEYKIAIKKVVCDSGGTDAYTNEDLDWYLRRESEEDISIIHLPFAMQSAESVVFEFFLF